MSDRSNSEPPVVAQPRRKDDRQRVLLSGRVVYRDGEVCFDVSLVNLSPSGARIRIPNGTGMPSHVHLIVVKTMTAYEAEVAWLRPPLAGLRFKQSYSLAKPLPDDVAYLKRLWLERAS